MRTDLYTVTAEDTAVKREGVTLERTLSHHQRTGRTNLDTGTTGDTVGIVQADIEWRRDNGVKAFAEHAIAVRADHIMTDTHTLCAVDALVGVAQNEAVRQVHLVVVVVARLTIMEAVIRQTMLDTVLLQVALTGGGTGTLKTASRLTLQPVPAGSPSQ